jgi:cell division protein ZapA
MESVEVVILGMRYRITGDEPPEYIQELAEFVDGKLREVREKSPQITPLKAAVLTALNIADELKKTRKEFESVSKEIRFIEDKAESIIKLFE